MIEARVDEDNNRIFDTNKVEITLDTDIDIEKGANNFESTPNEVTVAREILKENNNSTTFKQTIENDPNMHA